MASSRRKNTATRATFFTGLIIAARLALVVVLLAVTSLTARAADSALSQLDQQCLGCHSAKGLEMKLANGETLSLHVDGAAFAKSVHNKIGCAVCHANTSLENHPPVKTKIASIREYSLELTKVCQSCHAPIFKLYEGSIHAALLREGNSIAPVCTDCHSPHAVMAKAAYDAATGAPCSNCHGPIFNAYAGSVHGKADPGLLQLPPRPRRERRDHGRPAEERLSRVPPGRAGQPIRHGCRMPNGISRQYRAPPAIRRRPSARSTSGFTTTWHSSASPKKQGVPQFESRARSADAKGAGLDAMALQSLLREFNREGIDNKTTLRGRLEVSTGVEAHQLTRQHPGDPGLRQMPPARRRSVPERHGFHRRPRRQAGALRRAPGSPEFGDFGRFGGRFLRHRRHPDQVAGYGSSSSRCWAASACRSAI